MIYLYAIVDRLDMPLPTAVDLQETQLEVLRHREIGAVVGRCANVDTAPTAEAVWQHEQIIETLMEDRAVLPVRFGAVLADNAALVAELETHYVDLTADLARLRGHVELAVRVLGDDDGPPEHEQEQARPATCGTGRGYMLALVEQQRRAGQLVEQIHGSLAGLAVDSTSQVLITPRMLLKSAYLVDRDTVPAFQREINSLCEAHPALNILCTGPWPPFSFVTDSIGGEEQ